LVSKSSFQEADIRDGVASGGRLSGVFIICRPEERGGGWVLYLRTSWTRGYRPLRTFRDRSDRVFKDLGRLVLLVRNDFCYSDEISLFKAGDEALRRYRSLLPVDLADLGPGEEKRGVEREDFPSQLVD
jgi:hypothetical protein